MSQFKIQRGIEFLKIVLNELSSPQVLKIEEHPAIPHMWRRMQDIRFDSRREPFEYRSKHFPRMMRYLYLRHPDLPREFQEFTTDGMVFDLLTDFVRQNVLAGTLEDTLKNPENHEREYLFFAFKFFAAMESAKIEELSLQRGITVSAPAVLERGEDGALEILTGEDLEARKKNKKTKIVSWNPFGEDSIDDMIQVCRKKGEMEVISHIQDDGFEVMDFSRTDDGLTKIVAEKKETLQRIEVYTDNHGAPVHLIDTANPTKKQDFEGQSWRDELTVMSARAGKNPDVLAIKADEDLKAGPPKGEPRKPKIGTGTLKVDPHALEDALGVKAGHERSEFSLKPISESETEKLKTPRVGAPGTAHATFAPLPGPMRAIPHGITGGVEEDTVEELEEKARGEMARQTHRQRLTETGEITGRRPNQPRRREERKAQTQKPKKKQKSPDENIVAKVAIGTGIASATALTTSLLASLPT